MFHIGLGTHQNFVAIQNQEQMAQAEQERSRNKGRAKNGGWFRILSSRSEAQACEPGPAELASTSAVGAMVSRGAWSA